LNLNRR